MVLTVFAGIAEFERELIHERTSTGRTAAKSRGVRFGRPPKLTNRQWQALRAGLRWEREHRPGDVEEWLERFAPLAGLGTKEEDHLRFKRNQAGLLDALLAAQPEVHVDELFERVRERMRTFTGVKVAAQPAKKEPSAAIRSAGPARPRSAIWWPSIVVTTEEASPGILTRIAVVEPPYCAP